MAINESDPRYRFFKQAAEELVRRDFDMIPSILFEELAKHREDPTLVLTLVDNDERVCPNCNEPVDEGEENEDDDSHAWDCDSCDSNSVVEHVTYEELSFRDAVHGWPGAHGVCFWTRNEQIKSVAARCGFLVYEPVDFDGIILAIDGGGYDFYEAHWVPLYLRLGYKWHESYDNWEEACIQATVKLRPQPNKAEPGSETV